MTFVPAVYRERTKSPLNAASWILIVLILSTIFLSFVVSGSLALWPLFIAVPTIILWAFNRARGIYFVEVRSEGLYLNREGPEYAQQASSKCLFRFDDVKKISIVTRWNWFVEPPVATAVGEWGIRGRYYFFIKKGILVELKDGCSIVIGSENPKRLVQTLEYGIELHNSSEPK